MMKNGVSKGCQGYVYVLTNSYVPNVVKIGHTTRSPQVRAMEISQGTGVVGTWQVEYYWTVDDSYASEQLVFRELSEHRLPRSEMFQISAERAKMVMDAMLQVNSPEGLFNRQQYEAEKQAQIERKREDTAGEVGAFLKIKKTGVAIKDDIFTEMFLRVKVADLQHGGSFRPFVGFNNSDGGDSQFYAKSYDRGVTVSECSDPAWVGHSWFDYVQARQVQFPKNKPYNGVTIRGEVLKANGLKGATVEEGTVVGYSGTYMTSKPINALIREILAKGWEGEDVVVEISCTTAKSWVTNKTYKIYAIPTLRLLGLDDGELEF